MADRIRKINSQTGDVHAVITTDGLLPAGATIYGLAVSANGTIYAADEGLDVIYKVYEDGRALGAVVGKLGTWGDATSDGVNSVDGGALGGQKARLDSPWGICVDASDNIYVTDDNHKVKRLSPSGRCQTLAGTGVAGDVCNDNGLLSQFDTPAGIAVDKAGIVYVCDLGNEKIKKIWPSGKVTLLAGATGGGFANGNGANAKFDSPSGICVSKSGKIFVVDSNNWRIRQVDESGNVVTLAGFSSGFVDGVGNAARFSTMYDICVDNSGVIFVLDYGNRAIRRVLDDGKVTTLMHWEHSTVGASAIAVDNSGFLYILENNV